MVIQVSCRSRVGFFFILLFGKVTVNPCTGHTLHLFRGLHKVQRWDESTHAHAHARPSRTALRRGAFIARWCAHAHMRIYSGPTEAHGEQISVGKNHRDGESRQPTSASLQFVLFRDWKPKIIPKNKQTNKGKTHIKPVDLVQFCY